MKKYIITLLFCTLFCHLGIAQGLKSVSILGDSYSTFEGYVQPDTNFVWYLKTPPEGRKTDMVSVRNTWWHQFIKENNYRLCVIIRFPVLLFAIPVIVRRIIATVLLSPG